MSNRCHRPLHLDCPVTDPNLASHRPVPISTTPLLPLQTLFVVYNEILSGSGSSSTLLLIPQLPHTTPVQTMQAQAHSPLLDHRAVRAIRLGKGCAARRPRLAKACRVSSHRGLVHSTSPRYHSLYPHPSSHTRNLGRNMKVSQFIKQKTGAYRSGQISSHIQVLRSLWDTEGARVSPLNTTIALLPSVGFKYNCLPFPLLDFVLAAQLRELRRMGYSVGVRRPPPVQEHRTFQRSRSVRTRQGYCAEEIQVWCYSFSVCLADVQVYRVHPYLYQKIFHLHLHNATPVHMFECLPPQTDWT